MKYGRKTKASKGLVRYPRLAITLPPELMEAVEVERKPNETTSALIARLLKLALKGEKKC